MRFKGIVMRLCGLQDLPLVAGLAVGCSILLMAFGVIFSWMEEASCQDISDSPNLVFHEYSEYEEVPAAIVFETFTHKEKDALVKLKKKYPEKFEKVIRKKIGQKRESLLKLKENDPEEFQRILTESHQKLLARLRKLGEEDPEKVKELIQESVMWRKERFRKLCEDDPEKGREVVAKRREQFMKKMDQLKREDPETYWKMKEKIRQIRQKRKAVQEEGDTP